MLRDTTEQLKEQAEKARTVILETAKETAAVIAATAHETAEKSKGNFSYIAENAPEPFKEVAETALKAHSADTPKRFAKIHDFCLGIPYGKNSEKYQKITPPFSPIYKNISLLLEMF